VPAPRAGWPEDARALRRGAHEGVQGDRSGLAVARTNPDIRAALLTKLGVSKQRLSQLVKARKSELPMDTPMAVYTLAHEHEIDISRALGTDETREVRGLVADLRNSRQPTENQVAAPKAASKRQTAPKEVKVTIAGVDVGKIPALKQSHANEAKRMAERVYPALYIFENSVRDLIETVLRDKYGKDWWDQVPAPVQKRAADHKAAEGKDPWHGSRGGRPIDYVYLTDLWAIIRQRWPCFKHLFPSQAWVESLITSDMNVSRRPLAHMNPLGADDVNNIETAFRKWTRQLQAVADKLP